MNDNDYMQMALALALKGQGRVSPNPMVGAVIVNADRVVGKGFHRAVGGPHAEVHAIDEAARAASGATLYVTLEPCNHHGRTPPCTQKILEAGIQKVVVAMQDPNPDVAGGGNAFLRSQGIDVHCGVEEAAAKRLNESFIKYVRTRKPFVVLKIASTLDGRIATHTGDARWVTGPEARAHVHHLRHAMDAIMVGVGTVRSDDPQLTARLENDRGIDPIRIVLDTNLRMPESVRMLHQQSTAPTWVVCGPGAPKAEMERLQSGGAQLIEAPVKDRRVDLKALMAALGERGVTSLLIEGGAQVAGAALKAGVVDKVLLFYAPKIYGGDDGIPVCRGSGPDLMRDCLSIRQIEVTRMGSDVLVSGYPGSLE